jgi:hypothetical protein
MNLRSKTIASRTCSCAGMAVPATKSAPQARPGRSCADRGGRPPVYLGQVALLAECGCVVSQLRLSRLDFADTTVVRQIGKCLSECISNSSAAGPRTLPDMRPRCMSAPIAGACRTARHPGRRLGRLRRHRCSGRSAPHCERDRRRGRAPMASARRPAGIKAKIAPGPGEYVKVGGIRVSTGFHGSEGIAEP